MLERVSEIAAQILDADDCSLFLLDKSLNRLSNHVAYCDKYTGDVHGDG